MRPAALVAFVLLGSLAASAQVAQTANQRYTTAEGRQAVAAGLGASDRDQTERPKDLVASVGVREGMTVADIGTGVGYMLPYLSSAVGPRGKVLAEDIFDDFLAKAREKAQSAGLHNVEFVKGTEHSPKLPPHAVDLIFALDSYHHYNYPQEMLRASPMRSSPMDASRLSNTISAKARWAAETAHYSTYGWTTRA